MNTTVESTESSGMMRKRPWAALGVLAVAALAVAAAMVHVQTRPVDPHLAVLPDPQPTGTQAAVPEDPSPEPISATVKIGKSVVSR